MPGQRQRQQKPKHPKEKRPATPTFLLELPLVVDPGQATRLRAHLEAARQLYNAILSQGQKRLRRMRADAAWQAARDLPRTQKTQRAVAFSALRKQYGFTEAALHEAVKGLRVGWIAEHIDAVLAQTLATRAYRALNRVCLGQAKRVRFKSRGRGFSSIENKRNDTGLRFVLQPPEKGNAGFLLWNGDQLLAFIDWKDEVATHGLRHRIKYARLVQRPTSSPKAARADAEGYRYVVQLALEGKPHHKPKHKVGQGIVGATWVPRPWLSFPRKGRRVWRCSVRNWLPRPVPFAVCNGRWIGSGEQAIRRTTTRRGASKSKVTGSCGGSRANATRRPDDARRPKNGSWRRTARACMGARCTRCLRWAAPSSSKRSPTRHGRGNSARVWD
ncbi:hypothetical protein KSD_56410 [Ktedonobacter sp. SOSP1-85]|nr:hypothetical protein KSD_56410 [Ktedonobacter sp. SOSP1-85]